MGGKYETRASGGSARASDSVSLGQGDIQKNISTRTKFQVPGEITCYSGRDCTGWLIPRGTGWLAYTSSGRFIGQFGSDRLGASAIYQAHRPGGAT